ncbi:unnamed protein product [Didymodactylos carnosus]|uniref:Uncharacterized protein n=1 Tax=Didymodactylos carnosus TaxID=1234261 RepID=A0A814G5Y1_9BILA|nr:unnamed protein product [Didymodactylos carnosus]CAF0989350.1 unnamed protein product [Didymodactylos carnosus]CAF3631428.1 unnamed protein product [Didymodactylos carnosus]CAF3761481.1 unnamed protein product [Didymodactylos carnosus]
MDDTALSSDAIVSGSDIEDINFFLREKTLADMTTGPIESDHDHPVLSPEALIKQIQNHLSLLTDRYGGAMKEIKAILEKQQQLQIKLNEDKNANRSIFEQTFADSASENTNTLSTEAESDCDDGHGSKVAT